MSALTIREKCPSCGDGGALGREWVDLARVLHEQIPLDIRHWLCTNCRHTWYDKQGRFNSPIDAETAQILAKLEAEWKKGPDTLRKLNEDSKKLMAIMKLAPGILNRVENSYDWQISEGPGPAKPIEEKRDAYLKQLRELFS